MGVLGLLLGAAAWMVWQQCLEAEILRVELLNRHDQQRERSHLEAENERGRASEIPAEQLAALRNDHIALQRLRADVEAAKARTEKTKSAVTSRAAETAKAKAAEPWITEEMLPVAMWKNAGSATPLATLETILWAAAGGDVDLLARHLNLSGEARVKAGELFAQLPETIRRQFTSPEQMIAILTARDVPLGSASLRDIQIKNGNDVMLVAQLVGADKKSKFAHFSLRQEDNTWKVVVPVAVVEKYTQLLKASLTGTVK